MLPVPSGWRWWWWWWWWWWWQSSFQTLVSYHNTTWHYNPEVLDM